MKKYIVESVDALNFIFGRVILNFKRLFRKEVVFTFNFEDTLHETIQIGTIRKWRKNVQEED